MHVQLQHFALLEVIPDWTCQEAQAIMSQSQN